MLPHGNGGMANPVQIFVQLDFRRAKAAAVLLALSLGAAACGADSSSTDAGSAESAPPTVQESSEAEPESESESESASDTGSNEEAADPGDDSGDDVEESAASDAAPAENLFPDVDVLDIPTGETVNLKAELAGGDTPVLLWFWAPH